MPSCGMLGNELDLGFVDVRVVQGQTTSPFTNPNDFNALSTAATKLATFFGYTAAYINQLSVNDITYALRVAEESAGIR